MTTAPATNDNITLAQINELLKGAGLGAIAPDDVSALQAIESRERIIKAIRSASSNGGARQFLINLFMAADVKVKPHYDKAQGNSSQQQPAQQSTPQEQFADRLSVHVYSNKAALCFESDMTKAGLDTVSLDAATSSGVRQYDWGKKVRIQLTRGELPVVAAVLLGVIQNCEFKNHGQDNSKGFSIERQPGGKLFVKVFAKGEPLRAVPVMAPDAFYVTSLVMRQLQKANPWLDSTALLALIRATQAV